MTENEDKRQNKLQAAGYRLQVASRPVTGA